jgi:hypothetical protein
MPRRASLYSDDFEKLKQLRLPCLRMPMKGKPVASCARLSAIFRIWRGPINGSSELG